MTLVGLIFPMIHTKAQGHWPSGSEEDFKRFYPSMHGHGGHSGHVTRDNLNKLLLPHP